MKNTFRGMMAVAAALLLLGASAPADTTNYWTNAVSSVWNWSDAGNWDPNSAPSATTWVLFTNHAASAYTVKFTNSPSSKPFVVTTDKVTFDLNGKTWTCPPVGYWYGTHKPNSIASGAGETSTVTFSSSTPGGGGYNVSSVDYDTFDIGAGGTLNIDDSLGYGIRFYGPYAMQNYGSVTVSGIGAIYEEWPQFGANYGRAEIRNGGLWDITGGGWYQIGANSSLVVSNAGQLRTTRNSGIGGTVSILTNGRWSVNYGYESGGVNIGYSGNGKLIIDDGTVTSGGIWMNVGSGTDRGQLWIQNGGMLVLSNGALTVTAGSTAGFTNMLVLNNGQIRLGRTNSWTDPYAAVHPAENGVITNASILRGTGTISGQGLGKFLLYNAGTVEIGNSIGTLTLSNGTYYAAPSSTTIFEFDLTSSDLLYAPYGSLTFLGTNRFQLAAGAPAPQPGAKYGVGQFTFLVASNVTWTPAYDNLVYMLTNTYHLNYGVDFTYGMVNLNNGLFALELTFVPEPSTFLLLGLGGLLVWRRWAKRGKKVAGR